MPLWKRVNHVLTRMWNKRVMLKAFLIAVAVLVTVDAAVWESRYRTEVGHAFKRVAGQVTGQDWTSGPLV
jgi:hypothetical protein